MFSFYETRRNGVKTELNVSVKNARVLDDRLNLNIPEHEDLFFRQPVVRYKPGLARYWRAHRFFFQKSFFIPACSRQKQFTSYVAKLSRISSFSFFKSVELSLLHLVVASRLIGTFSIGQV